MIQRVFGAAIVAAVLAIGGPAWAEGPMTPLRHLPAPAAAAAAPDLAAPAAVPAAPPAAVASAPRLAPPAAPQTGDRQSVEPLPPAFTQQTPPPSAEANAAPYAQPEEPLPEMRGERDGGRRGRGRGWSKHRWNRQFFGAGWSGVSVPYQRGYGPAPYSASGN